MRDIQLEIVEQGLHGQDLKEFWLRKWRATMKVMTGEEITEESFYEQSYFYALRYRGEVIGVMSSTWQDTHENLAREGYYAAYPETIEFLKRRKIHRFHKMGMIVANLRAFPKGFKFTPVIIGCGLSFVFNGLKDCEAVVSFPRVDTTVFQSCIDWGSESIQSGLVLYGCPVHLIYVDRGTFKINENDDVKDMVENLLGNAIIKINGRFERNAMSITEVSRS